MASIERVGEASSFKTIGEVAKRVGVAAVILAGSVVVGYDVLALANGCLGNP